MGTYRQPKSIIADIGAKFNRAVADEIVRDCQRRNKDPWYDFIHLDVLDRVSVLEAWTTPEARAYIDGEMAKASQSKKSSTGLGSDNELVAAKAAIDLLGQHFIITSEQGLTLYSIVDPINRIVMPVVNNAVPAQVSQVIKQALWAQGMAASTRFTHYLLDLFQNNADLTEKPVLWAQKDDDTYCLGRALVLPDATVPFPYLGTVLDRMNDAEAFGAWFFGVYSGQYRGRQMLYLSDPIGESGKSSAVRALEALFNLFCDPADGVVKPAHKARITASLNWNILKDSSHASSHFDGKKFVWIGDNKNPNILMTQAVKELSGDDMAMLNPKHLPAYSTYLEAFLMVLGNCEPNITSEKHNITRTLWIKLAPLDVAEDKISASWANHYTAEMPGFLAWAERCYQDRCTNNTKIRVNAAVEGATELKIREFEDEFSVPFDAHFMIDADASLPAAEFNRVTVEILKMGRFEAANFKTWIERNYDIVKTASPKTGWCYRGLRLKSPRDRHGGKDGLMEGVVTAGEGFTMKPSKMNGRAHHGA